ncbi:MAG: hypothetical protein QM723_19740 [Myxococcaceae bacterium]
MGTVRALDIWLLEKDPLRLRVCAVESLMGDRPNVIGQVQWRTLRGDATVDSEGRVAGSGLLEARFGEVVAHAAVARVGDVLSLLTSMDFWYDWRPGRDSQVAPHLQRSGQALGDQVVTLRCADPSVARVHEMRLHPIAAGTTKVELEWAGLIYETTLRVVDVPLKRLDVHVPVEMLDGAGNKVTRALGSALDFHVYADIPEYNALDLLEYVKVEISSPAVRLVQKPFGWQLLCEQTGTAQVTARAGGLEAHLDVLVYDPADVEVVY